MVGGQQQRAAPREMLAPDALHAEIDEERGLQQRAHGPVQKRIHTPRKRALVQGVNVVKKELGLPVTPSQAADPKFSLLRTT